MSSRDHRDTPAGVRETPADHFQAAYPMLRPLVLAQVADGGPLHHLAQCRNGVLDYSLDVLGDGTPMQRLADSGWADSSLDQQLAMTVTQLNRRLADAVTGELIRVVVECDDGGVICDSIVPGIHLIGAVAFDDDGGPDARARVAEADRGVALVASEVRNRLRLGSLNFGSYETPSVPEASHPDRPRLFTSGATGHPHFSLCVAALDTRDVHYVAFYRGGSLLFAVDVFDDGGVEHFFAFIARTTRRRFYEKVCNDSEAIVADLCRSAWPLVDLPPNRVVLDVEQGAIFFFQLSGDDYLVGVTLDQTQVANSDQKLHELAGAIRSDASP
ncbi:hypothetical protein [Actinoplanes derwentensis]|uniref:Uncharacterized protein n=1 Tax=Actinoplanes derwentensis TaxID=113562 RepID=A0A1H1T143_9ACTN|nr:hypothetical protein [Actinoplanes derwentensis]GID89906.1 hypothetical protein Ade03nite_88300 [Actinoplanes derwentensis]SDS53884.1 hypothetical protein SAMN04489716_1007 [Actinoplanes derwentensis]